MQQKLEVDDVARAKPFPQKRVVRFDFGFLLFFLGGMDGGYYFQDVVSQVCWGEEINNY